MKTWSIIAALLIMSLAGIIFFMHQESWIIFNFPQLPAMITNKPINKITYKQAKLFIWQNKQFKEETCQIIDNAHTSSMMTDLIDHFLIACQEKALIDQPVQAESVIISKQDLFISFNHSPFNKQSSTHHKLMFVQSLIKTIKQFNSQVMQIQLLVHHQPIQDPHLSFDSSFFV